MYVITGERSRAKKSRKTVGKKGGKQVEEKVEKKVGRRKNMRKISMVLTGLRRFVAATYVSPPHVAATCCLVRTGLKSMKSD